MNANPKAVVEILQHQEAALREHVGYGPDSRLKAVLTLLLAPVFLGSNPHTELRATYPEPALGQSLRGCVAYDVQQHPCANPLRLSYHLTFECLEYPEEAPVRAAGDAQAQEIRALALRAFQEHFGPATQAVFTLDSLYEEEADLPSADYPEEWQSAVPGWAPVHDGCRWKFYIHDVVVTVRVGYRHVSVDYVRHAPSTLQ